MEPWENFTCYRSPNKYENWHRQKNQSTFFECIYWRRAERNRIETINNSGNNPQYSEWGEKQCINLSKGWNVISSISQELEGQVTMKKLIKQFMFRACKHRGNSIYSISEPKNPISRRDMYNIQIQNSVVDTFLWKNLMRILLVIENRLPFDFSPLGNSWKRLQD